MSRRLHRVAARPLPAFKNYVETLAKWLHELDAWALAVTLTIKRHDHRCQRQPKFDTGIPGIGN